MYVKLFSKILDSSIWMEPAATKIVWITLLAAKDQDGFAQFASIRNLAQRAVVTVEEAKTAVECLSGPDIDSTNPKNEGRRIERVPGGYIILNSEQYRNLKDQITKREQDRRYAVEYRLRKKRQEKLTNTNAKLTRPDSSVSVSVCSNSKRLGTVKSISTARARGSFEEVEKFCVEIGLAGSDGEWFFNKCEGCGWQNGGKPIKDWRATLRAWRTAGYLPSQKQKSQEPEWRE